MKEMDDIVVTIQQLYKIRGKLIDRYQLPVGTADVATRLYVFLAEYPYGVSPAEAALMLERGRGVVERHFDRLREKGVFEKIHNGAWNFRKEVKEVLNATD